jgi:shikimate kinase
MSEVAEDKNIVITGFMGTGKTTVGRIIAQMTGRAFVDTDEVIAQQVGLSIPEIFARAGEPGFRRMERDLALPERTDRLVISTGGGMLLDEDNRRVMLAAGFVVCLTATTEAITKRVSNSVERPLLKGDWRALLQKRRAAYAAIPNQVDTTDKTPEAVAEEVMALWRNAFG